MKNENSKLNHLIYFLESLVNSENKKYTPVEKKYLEEAIENLKKYKQSRKKSHWLKAISFILKAYFLYDKFFNDD